MTSSTVKRPSSAGDLGVEDDLQEEVAQLAGEVLVRALVDGHQHLVGLLEGHRLQAGVGLLAVPRAAAGRAEPRDQAHEVRERRAGAAGGVHALFFIA